MLRYYKISFINKTVVHQDNQADFMFVCFYADGGGVARWLVDFGLVKPCLHL